MHHPASASRPSKIWSLPPLMFLFVLLGQLLIILPAIKLFEVSTDKIASYPHIIVFLVGPFSITAMLIYGWIRLYEGDSLHNMGVRAFSYQCVLGGAIAALVMGSASVASIAMLGGYVIESAVSLSLGQLIPPVLLLLGFTVQASAEEFLFRGWLLHRISAAKGVKWGIVGNSVLFVLMHLLGFDFEQSSIANLIIFSAMLMLFALFLSLVTIRRGSIWWACGWHVVWNWLFINAFGLPTTGISLNTPALLFNLQANSNAPQWLTGGSDGPENSVATLLVFAVSLLVWHWRTKTKQPAK